MDSDRKHRAVRITVWVAVLGLLLGVLSSLVTALGADAHASLRSVSPADGSTVRTAPAAVVLTFDEPISSSFATVAVTGPGGDAGNGRAKVDGTKVSLDLDAGLPDGTYKVAFRVVSEDGHPVSDTSTFRLAAAAPTSSAPSTSSGTDSPAPTMTPLPQSSSSSASVSSSEKASAATASGTGNGTGLRLGLAVGVGALAVAAGTALVAAARRRRQS
ncbi:copper resistance CopC family protein [Pedococcus sp. 2YAF34]|uniref:copper resistance CopC family protein n=1 Tax=Pedococcus sp. 2YAF34 TaxID=3233032 RepID=UPI003F9A191D